MRTHVTGVICANVDEARALYKKKRSELQMEGVIPYGRDDTLIIQTETHKWWFVSINWQLDGVRWNEFSISESLLHHPDKSVYAKAYALGRTQLF